MRIPHACDGFSPIVLKVIAGAELVHESVSIDVGPAVHENAILGIQLPDEIPAPVVVVHHRAGRMLLLKESGRGRGKMLSFRFSLAPHYLSDPGYGEAGEGQEHNQIKSQRSRSQPEYRLARQSQGSPLLQPGLGHLGEHRDDDQHQNRDVAHRAQRRRDRSQ